MTLTLQLTPEEESRLLAEAERRGQDVAEFVARLIVGSLPTPGTAYGHLQETLSPEEWIQSLREWAASHDPSLPPLSDEAISRESIYDGNPRWPT